MGKKRFFLVCIQFQTYLSQEFHVENQWLLCIHYILNLVKWTKWRNSFRTLNWKERFLVMILNERPTTTAYFKQLISYIFLLCHRHIHKIFYKKYEAAISQWVEYIKRILKLYYNVSYVLQTSGEDKKKRNYCMRQACVWIALNYPS